MKKPTKKLIPGVRAVEYKGKVYLYQRVRVIVDKKAGVFKYKDKYLGRLVPTNSM